MDKRVQDSQARQNMGMMYRHMTEHRSLLSGVMLGWMSDLANVVASRHCGLPVDLVAVDTLEFKQQPGMNDLLVLDAQITYVGRTSMEVRVDAWGERLDADNRSFCRAYMVMVAVDENNVPVPVPGIILETEEQRQEWENGEKRAEIRHARRNEAL